MKLVIRESKPFEYRLWLYHHLEEPFSVHYRYHLFSIRLQVQVLTLEYLPIPSTGKVGDCCLLLLANSALGVVLVFLDVF